MAEAPKTKLLDVECLRAVAIAYTVVAHLRFSYVNQPRWVSWLDARAHFWSGVDLFFVISGFVIAKNLIPQFTGFPRSDWKDPAHALWNFWRRRIFRLWPSSWLWAALAVGVAAVLFPPLLKLTASDFRAAILQIYNFHAFACVSGHASDCSNLLIGVYWSLSLEEQFYIVLPILFFFLRAQAKWAIIALGAAGVSLSFLWPEPLAFFRWEGFCLGVLLAWLFSTPALHARLGRLLEKAGWLTWVVSAAMLVALPLIAHGTFGSRPYPVAAAASAVLVALASYDRNFLGVPKAIRGAMVFLGARSYSIYLVHIPVLVAFQKLAGFELLREDLAMPERVLGHLLWVGAAVGTVVLFSDLNFRFVESRFRRLGERARPSRVPA